MPSLIFPRDSPFAYLALHMPHMSKFPPPRQTCNTRRGNTFEKGGGLQVQKMGMMGESRWRGGGGGKVATWHGQ